MSLLSHYPLQSTKHKRKLDACVFEQQRGLWLSSAPLYSIISVYIFSKCLQVAIQAKIKIKNVIVQMYLRLYSPADAVY